MEKSFIQWKKQCLNKLDLSKKGSVDEGIEHVVSLLNSCEEYFTTSSCSGRIILIDGAPESSDVQKQNCVWLFVSHQKCTSDDLMSALAGCCGDAVLKFEPFVLHLQCRRLEDAQLMAVRSTHGLEVPLSHDGKLLVQQEYIAFLTQVANQKMEENRRRIHRFYQNLQSALLTEKCQRLQIKDPLSLQQLQDPPHAEKTEKETEEEKEKEERKKTSVYKRRRKRERHQPDCSHGDGDSSVPDLDDCLDLFT
ncbi:tRNA wybutosine-synthesizing protein 3 homolog isoform X2 [Archocentrus centrarchus]|uniref:tRNA wybutosine-synthesizing protein 3 homolog isoform X2 n=1 Tax=Archocentrus centrarchus TaxID=63155 RepID=UPI0011E9EA87|nr:tRNA wybutosine-synthesizing protein 3 homolog isoform X2 [Archocentrus centrarchus]